LKYQTKKSRDFGIEPRIKMQVISNSLQKRSTKELGRL
jgi:hypothetical protein